MEALKHCAMNPPELMMLDIWMPEMDGLETLKRLRTGAQHAGNDDVRAWIDRDRGEGDQVGRLRLYRKAALA